MVKTQKSKLKVLSISIAIVFVFFIGYGIETFYESPNFEDFCDYGSMSKDISNQIECEELNGTWESFPREYLNESRETRTGYCDLYTRCNEAYMPMNENYSRNLFIITFIIGLIALIVGNFFIKVESVGSGIMGGGTLTIIYGTLRNWMYLNDYLRFVILGLVLAILIWIGYKKIKE